MVWFVFAGLVLAAFWVALEARRIAREALTLARVSQATSASIAATTTARAADTDAVQSAFAHGLEDARARLQRLEARSGVVR